MTADTSTDLALSLADTVSRVLGSLPGCRITHEDGIVLRGTFTASPRARELTRAAHMQGDPVPVVVRFSNGFPDPAIVDADENNPRGMAVKFTLPDGSTTDLVCQDWPVFPAGTPEAFRDLIAAQGEGEAATLAFLADHPDVAAAGALVAEQSGQPPRSWATWAFNSLNAFRLVDADGNGRFVRFRYLAERGEQSLPVEERAGAAPHYLHEGVVGELPFRYRVLAQLAAPEDQTTDASKAWPEDREWADLGGIEITAVDTEQESDGSVLVFDPTRLTDGIEPSDDPILHIRRLVYSESVRRRTCPVEH
ncbi:catalase family peroxidase [Pseudonocardia spirodelae]|uniref:Catalase-related peroxidase n=1 Tax=Pseudonocardia spirodelae TaxID=3133431 RepID=A0ABU8TBQ2_9PSEU